MPTLRIGATFARFDPYEIDLRAGEVRKYGIRLKLGEQPLQILIMLLERPGEVVTRDELRDRLWSHTFVDFEHSLNSAVQRLREKLSDTAGEARWIETVPRRGYRFVGQVEWVNGKSLDNASVQPPVPRETTVLHNEAATPPPIAIPQPPIPQPTVPGLFRWALIAALMLLGVIAYRTGFKPISAKRSSLSSAVVQNHEAGLASHAPINPEAREAYEKARFLWFSKNAGDSKALFEKAIQIQPDYAAAWSGLGDSYGRDYVTGVGRADEVPAKWEAAARKAIELDSSLSDAHNSLAAWYLYSKWDFSSAESECRRAVALDRKNAENYHLCSYVLLALNQWDEAVEMQKQGTSLDPSQRPDALAEIYFRAHRFDAAIEDLTLRKAADPQLFEYHDLLADLYFLSGHPEKSVSEWELEAAAWPDHAVQAIRRANKKGGYPAVADFLLTSAEHYARKAHVATYELALYAARARQKEKTLDYLEEAVNSHDPWIIFLQTDPLLDFVHGEPRFQAVVKKIGLPPLSAKTEGKPADAGSTSLN